VKTKSYNSIVKNTTFIAGAQFVQIIVKIIFTKFVSVTLGPAGIGLYGLYQASISLIQTGTSLGLNFSAVKKIAEAVSTNDEDKIAESIIVLRRWVLFTGLLGFSITLLLSEQLSIWTFNNSNHTTEIRILSIVLLTAALTSGQTALLQGLRKIKQMATSSVIGSLLGLATSLPIFLYLGVDGIIPSIIITSLTSLLLSWYFAKTVKIVPKKVGLKSTIAGGTDMVKLGMVSVYNGLGTVFTAYLLRIFISKDLGIEAVGLFQAAWGITMIYLQMIFSSMGSDYYPRLIALKFQDKSMVKEINEQLTIALLIASPIIVGFVGFCSIIVQILYSGKFNGAVPILEWQLAATPLRVLSWAIAFTFLAKDKNKLFAFTETLFQVILVSSIIGLWSFFKLEAAGIGYLITYLIYFFLVFILAKKLINFKFTKLNIKLIIINGGVIIALFISNRFVSDLYSQIFNALIFFTIVIYSFLNLDKLINIKSIIDKFLKKIKI
jgi:enterobacterial common antigen flippase